MLEREFPEQHELWRDPVTRRQFLMLMGASLPALARLFETNSSKSVSWLGYLYSANIAGGVVGCLAAGFYLLRVHDMAVATYAAAASRTHR